MYIEEKRTIRLSDLTFEKIYKCKKDIKCENGTFKKGTLVYLIETDSQKIEICNIEEWDKSKGYSIFCCPKDCSLERITVDNFNDYFVFEEMATLKYKEINAENDKYDDLLFRFDSLSKLSFELDLILMMITVALLNSTSISIYYVLILILVFFVLGITSHFMSEIIDNKKGTIYAKRRIEVIEAAKDK